MCIRDSYKGESSNAELQLGIHQGDKTMLADAAAGDITNLGVELAYVTGPMSFQAEYFDNETELEDGSKVLNGMAFMFKVHTY